MSKLLDTQLSLRPANALTVTSSGSAGGAYAHSVLAIEEMEKAASAKTV